MDCVEVCVFVTLSYKLIFDCFSSLKSLRKNFKNNYSLKKSFR